MVLLSLLVACSGGDDSVAPGAGPSWSPPSIPTAPLPKGPVSPTDPPYSTEPGVAAPPARLDLAFLECDGRDWQLVVETTGRAERVEVVVAVEPDEDHPLPAGGASLEMIKVETGSSLWTRFETRWSHGECTRYRGVFSAIAYDDRDRAVGCRWWGPSLDTFALGQLDDVFSDQAEMLAMARSRCPLNATP
ncbi:MAG: hypothetical protein AAGA48_17190 [Myxococcota bacterium]